MADSHLVPLCTSPDAEGRGLRLHEEGVAVLHGAKLATRKVALVGVLYVPEDDALATVAERVADRGLFLSSSAVSVAEQDASMLLLVLRGVNLAQEPFWGSLLFVLSSHVVIAKNGPITSSSFQAALPFLAAFNQLQVGEGAVDPDRNSTLLKEIAPRFTWGAVDLKIKDMNGCDSASTYFEQQLAAGSTDGQMLLTALVPARDCVVLKSNSFQTPEDPHTSPKLLTHVADRLECKSFFGRYLNGTLMVRLMRSLTHAMAAPDGAPVVLQRVVTNVFAAHWQELVQRAFKSYCDMIHARLAVYEKAPITAEYLVDVTEKKLKANQSQSNQQAAVVDAGQGNYSVFDEFGNLKKHQPTEDEKGDTWDENERRITELEGSLEDKERQVKHITKANAEWGRQEHETVAQIEQTHAEQVSSLHGAIRSTETQIESALAEQQVLYQSTMQATRHTIDTVDKVADKGRVVSGYLERYEKAHVFSSRWRQYFYVVKHDTLTCYKSKSNYEERGPPFERPISISGYSVERSRTDELKIKLVPPEAGHQKLRFRAPASVGRETWMKRFTEATQFTTR
ncbi:hypothetical protein PHMEG_00012190 [Phytophthora megakarya]|uniref:PH domain-containing protein n=1 Tax=Phytophthora megakarya TaxID=4795 RepID=A0A225WAB2_9STRA|nr:hypothetical protein PHMEG_00012190 [Phytophthora megakarya]